MDPAILQNFTVRLAFTNSITPNQNICSPTSQIVKGKVAAFDRALKFPMARRQEYSFFEQGPNTVLVILGEIMRYLQAQFHGYALRGIQIYNEHISRSNIFFFQHFLEKLLCTIQISCFPLQAFYESL